MFFQQKAMKLNVDVSKKNEKYSDWIYDRQSSVWIITPLLLLCALGNLLNLSKFSKEVFFKNMGLFCKVVNISSKVCRVILRLKARVKPYIIPYVAIFLMYSYYI